MAHQSVLTGYAPPCPVLVNLRISEAAPALVWPTLVHSSYTVDSRQHRGVAVDVCVHGLRDLRFGPMSGSFRTGQKISLRLQGAVVVGVYQRIIQRVESPGVPALFRLVPRVFKGNNF